ncbi:3'-5' DNA helicase [Tulasnella sp. 408]|nr:3'-5' DNA helicase [Tulasnella sp. 408]
MAKNPHFRVLALSATPGGKPEAVQEVVDSLHISHIEIRNEDSLDLRQYIHKKDILHTVVPMTGSVNKIKVLLAAAMEPLADKLGKAGIVSIQDVVRLHPYRCQATIGQLGQNGGARQPWAFGTLQKLGKLARAMGYLMEQSVAMCYKSLTGSLDADEQGDGAKKKSASGRKAPRLDGDPAVKKVIAEIDAQRRARMGNFPNHPKLDRLLQIALTHFESTPDADTTRVMVFCTFRDCVDEIVEVLNGHSTTLRATRFVGQGVDSSGRKGMAQKDQIELVNQFKQGTYNILVATSIGEEGLDIGEVDLIICYDSQKTPIRMLQRIGRTGRKRNGRIEVLSAAGREEFNYQKAGDSYKDVQDAIVRGEDLELYADVERLLPDEYKPRCAERIMQIEEFVREEPEEAGGKGRKRKTGAGGAEDGVKKRKRKSAGGSLAMDIPEGAAKGFVPVNELIARGAKGKGKAAKASPAPSRSRLDEYDPDMIAPEDDDDDDDLPELPVPKSWTQSAAASPPSKASGSKVVGFTSAKALVDKGMDSDEDAEALPPLKKKPKSSAKGTATKPASTGKAAATAKVDKGKGKAKGTPPLSELNTAKPPSSKGKVKPPSKRSASPIVIPSSPEQALPPPKARPPIVKNPSKTAVLSASKPVESCGGTDKSMSWLLSDDEDDAPRRPMMKPGAPRIKPSRPNPPSPTIPIKPKPPQTLGLSKAAGPGTFKVPFAVPRRTPLTMPSGAPVGSSSERAEELDGLDDPSFEIDIPEIPSSKAVDDDSMEVDEPEDLDVDSSFGVRAPGFKRPQVPQRPVAELSSPDVSMSFPVRRAGVGGRLRRGPSRAVPDSDDHDESVVEQPSSPGHITILDTSIESPAAASPPPRRRRPRKQNQMRSKIGHAMFDMEAGHSGDEVSEGSTCSEGEYDTSFVTYGAATQAPEGYDQAAMYRRGLMTQAGSDGPAFAKRPVRYGQFTGGGAGRRGGRISDMSSEVGEYELGSFVVEDDDEMMDVSMDSER